MPGSGHKSICPGQRALVRLHDGSVFVDRFVADRDSHIVFAERGRVPSVKIRTVAPYRPLEGSQHLGEQLCRTCVLCGNTYQAREAAKMVVVADKPICRGCARQIAEQFN
jgi:hypothetical protein